MKPPDWYTRFLEGMTDLLSVPLDVRTGTLRAPIESYPAPVLELLCDTPGHVPAERLSVYHRQRWFRYFQALQTDHPLAARTVGLWDFNQVSRDYLLAHPPSGFDLQTVGNHFADFASRWRPPVGGLLPRRPGGGLRVPLAAFRQAAAIDRAILAAFHAPLEASWRPSPSEAASLPEARLRFAAHVSFVEEDWDLLERRDSRPPDDDEAPFLLGRKLSSRRRWAIFRVEGGWGRLPLEPAHACVLEALRNGSLAQSMEVLSRRGHAPRAMAMLGSWMEQGISLGWWTGCAMPGDPM